MDILDMGKWKKKSLKGTVFALTICKSFCSLFLLELHKAKEYSVIGVLINLVYKWPGILMELCQDDMVWQSLLWMFGTMLLLYLKWDLSAMPN